MAEVRGAVRAHGENYWFLGAMGGRTSARKSHHFHRERDARKAPDPHRGLQELLLGRES